MSYAPMQRQVKEKKSGCAILLTVIISVVALICLVVVVAFAYMFSQTWGRAKEKAQRVHDTGNLKQIALACLMFSGDHDGDFPPDFATLVEEGYIGPGNVWVLSKRTKKLPPGSAANLRSGQTDYVYVGMGKSDNDKRATSIPIAHTKSTVFPKWINVAYADGHVEGYPVAAFQDIDHGGNQSFVSPTKREMYADNTNPIQTGIEETKQSVTLKANNPADMPEPAPEPQMVQSVDVSYLIQPDQWISTKGKKATGKILEVKTDLSTILFRTSNGKTQTVKVSLFNASSRQTIKSLLEQALEIEELAKKQGSF